MENRSYEERHQSALEVFDAFMAGSVADPEPVSYTHLTLPTILLV